MKQLDQITQASYLTATNATQYRNIMRIFYLENEKLHFKLYKEDVYNKLTKIPGFENYSMDQLKLDLAMLVTWKNLTPIQDPRRVYSIEDYKNKQFQYSMSEYALEIERMTVRLESLFLESSTLSSHYFVRILRAMEEIQNVSRMSSKEVNQWWRSLQEDFTILNQNYKDYLREFYSSETEKLLKSVEFLIHKDRFISYLREFIRELQEYSTKIQLQIQKMDKSKHNSLINLIIASELDIPRPNSEQSSGFEEQIRERIPGLWEIFVRWFCGSETQLSESDMVLEITNEIIRKVIQNASLILQMQGVGMNRKEDYRHYMKLFENCQSIDDAHCLSAMVFGVFQIEHFHANADRNTDSINSSVYDEEPMTYQLNPRTNKYRPRIDKTGFVSRAFEKIALRQAHLDKIDTEKEMVLKYKNGNRLEIASIRDIIPLSTKNTLLRWIAAANTTSDRISRTEYGQTFQLLRDDTETTLHCVDGDLTMPCYTLLFLEDV